MVGKIANEQQALSRRILAEHGFEFVTEYVCGPRLARALHILLFNRQDAEERQRAGRCCRALLKAYAEAGYPIARAPLDMQQEAMDQLEVLPDVLSASSGRWIPRASWPRASTASRDGPRAVSRAQ